MATTTTAQQVGANVRAEAARRKVSGSAVARAIGLSQSAMSRRLAGEYPFSVTELAQIALYLDVPVSSLLPDATVGAA
jgi:transcriptional regulator with XRE-family HTH domain